MTHTGSPPRVSLLLSLLPAVCSKNENLKLPSICIVDASGSSPARSWSQREELLVSGRIALETGGPRSARCGERGASVRRRRRTLYARVGTAKVASLGK